jgi:hypothetical protein
MVNIVVVQSSNVPDRAKQEMSLGRRQIRLRQQQNSTSISETVLDGARRQYRERSR